MTTLEAHAFTCPLCGNTFESTIVASTNSFGPLHSDLYREASGTQPICFFVHTCTNCGYTGFEGDFQPQSFDARFPGFVADMITPEVKARAIKTSGHYYLAALCAEWRGATAQSLGRIYHMGAWCCRISGENVKEKFYLGKAAEYFEQAIAAGEPAPDGMALYSYIVGDLYRRLGEAEKARTWYERAIEEVNRFRGEPEVAGYAKRQMENPADIF